MISAGTRVAAVIGHPVAHSLSPALHNAAFAQLGIDTTLMIYVANPLRVVELATPLLARYPQLRLRVALSLEHSLSREESLFQLPEDERAHRIALIERGLVGDNFMGIALQPSAPWLTRVAGLK